MRMKNFGRQSCNAAVLAVSSTALPRLFRQPAMRVVDNELPEDAVVLDCRWDHEFDIAYFLISSVIYAPVAPGEEFPLIPGPVFRNVE